MNLFRIIALTAFLPLLAHGASFPYVTLNGKTNRLSDNGTRFTLNGAPMGTNWVDSGTTNATLAGVATIYGGVTDSNRTGLALSTTSSQFNLTTTGSASNIPIWLHPKLEDSLSLGNVLLSDVDPSQLDPKLVAKLYGTQFDLIGDGVTSFGISPQFISGGNYGSELYFILAGGSVTNVQPTDVVDDNGFFFLSGQGFNSHTNAAFGGDMSLRTAGPENSDGNLPARWVFRNIKPTSGAFYDSLTIEADGHVTIPQGSVTTAAPSGGTAAAWKLGSYKTNAVTLVATNYVEVEIGGVLRKLAIVQ